MKTTVGKIVEGEQTLAKIFNANFADGSIAVRVSRCVKPLLTEIEDFYKLREKFAKPFIKEGATTITKGQPGYDEIIKYVKEMESTEIEFDGIEVFDNVIFNGLKGISMADIEYLTEIGLVKADEIKVTRRVVSPTPTETDTEAAAE